MQMVKQAVASSGTAHVRHLALDMGEAWGVLANELLHGSNSAGHVHWQCLMIDPDSPQIQAIASPSVSPELARSRIEMMRDFMRQHAVELGSRNVELECRLCSREPNIHGFHVAGCALLWSMCDIVTSYNMADTGVSWKLDGLNTPYWRFDAMKDNVLSSHPARAFSNWVDYWWQQSPQAWTS
jgi:hypothetical protein